MPAKKGRKKVVRRRRTTRSAKTKDLGLNLMKGATAMAGGALGSFVTGMFEDSGNEFMQKSAPWFTAGAGLIGAMFLPDNIKPAAYGLLGQSGSEVFESMSGNGMGYVPNMDQQMQRYNALSAQPMMGILR